MKRLFFRAVFLVLFFPFVAMASVYHLEKGSAQMTVIAETAEDGFGYPVVDFTVNLSGKANKEKVIKIFLVLEGDEYSVAPLNEEQRSEVEALGKEVASYKKEVFAQSSTHEDLSPDGKVYVVEKSSVKFYTRYNLVKNLSQIFSVIKQDFSLEGSYDEVRMNEKLEAAVVNMGFKILVVEVNLSDRLKKEEDQKISLGLRIRRPVLFLNPDLPFMMSSIFYFKNLMISDLSQENLMMKTENMPASNMLKIFSRSDEFKMFSLTQRSKNLLGVEVDFTLPSLFESNSIGSIKAELITGYYDRDSDLWSKKENKKNYSIFYSLEK